MQLKPRILLTATATTLGALALVGAALPGTAAAAGRDDAPGQVKRSESAPAAAPVTEDNDTNDGGTPNNVADAGDNQHPSGKDRSVEHGGSGNQGRSTSDPDDDGRGPDRSNGGPDKPGGAGGVDKADQDGNNGCGNDDDFEDDNEGWCGRKPAKATAPAPAPAVEAAEKDDGKVKPVSCPEGMVDTNGAAAGGCETPAPAPQGEVLSNAAVAVPDACILAALLGAGPMPVGCDARLVAQSLGEAAPFGAAATAEPAAPASVRSEVLSASLASDDSSPTVSARSTGGSSVLGAAASGVVGALAFTGSSVLTLLVLALLAIAAGVVLTRSARRRQA